MAVAALEVPVAVNVAGDPVSPDEAAWTVMLPDAVGVSVTDALPAVSLVVDASDRLAAPAVTLQVTLGTRPPGL